jgi:heptosyltransferase-2/heptosyltransferase-3
LRSPRRNSLRLRLLRLAARCLPARAPGATPPSRVLLLRPDHIGDVLLTAPAVGLLRASLPAAQLTYVVGPWSLEAARHGPAVDRLAPLAYPGFSRRPNANVVDPYLVLAREAARLRREAYDLSVVFRPDHWWGALLTLAAGIPLRVGGRVPETEPLLSHTHLAAPLEHWAEQALNVARLALTVSGASAQAHGAVTAFAVSSAARAEAAAFWQRHALDDQTVIAVQPSAGAPLKSWPVDRWARLADALVERQHAVVLVGGPADRGLLEQIRARMLRQPAASTHGQSLDASAALYERCALLVGLDGGAAHLAGAVGTPTVRLYGPTAREIFGPWPSRSDQHVVITRALQCVPCGHLQDPPCGATSLPACLLALGVDDVLNTVEQQVRQG